MCLLGHTPQGIAMLLAVAIVLAVALAGAAAVSR